MNQSRFRLARSKKSFDCYDCQGDVMLGAEFAWDNFRNVRICERCWIKLSDLVKEDENKPKKERWRPGMVVKPWEIGDWDINSWPEELQKEYVRLNSGREQYPGGLKEAQERLRNKPIAFR
jgi:hypothetical protein